MISQEDIIKIAGLSRLSLTEQEVQEYQEEFSNILGFFEVLSEVDTNGVEPTAQITGLENVVREDREESFDSDSLIECSPQQKVKTQIAVSAVM